MHPALIEERKAEAEAVGLRLRACMKELLALDTHEPPTAPSIGDLLGLDGVVAKRLVKVCRDDLSPVQVLTSAPSVANLRAAIESAQAKGLDHLAHWAAADAVNKFEKLINAASPSGSKSELTKWLRSIDDEDRAPAPEDDGARLSITASGDVVASDGAPFAVWFDGNILNPADRERAAALLAAAPHAIVARSGTLAESLGDLHIGTWSAEGVTALGGALRELLDAAPGATVYLAPAPRDVLGDVQRTKNFFRDADPDRVKLALNPALLISEDMLDNASDHLRRAAESLAPIAGVVIIPADPSPLNHEAIAPFLRALPPTTALALPEGAAGDTIRQSIDA